VNFISRYTFWEKLEPTCHMSKTRPNHLIRCGRLARCAGTAGAAGSALWLVPGPEHLLSLEQHLDEHDSLKNVGLIQRWRLTSMGPLVGLINRHNRHSQVILGVPERRQCITRHEGGRATPIHPRAGRN
jgi:hypothetical protein